MKQNWSTLAAIIIVLIAVAYVVIESRGPKSDTTKSTTRSQTKLDSIKSELRTVERGDFVEFKGRWYEVRRNFTTPELDDQEFIRLYFMNSIDLYLFNVDEVGRIVRWQDGYEEYAKAAHAFALQ